MTFTPTLDVLPEAQRALWPVGGDVAAERRADVLEAVDRALSEFVRRARSGLIFQLVGSGLWEGDLAEMRADRPRSPRPDGGGSGTPRPSTK